MEEFILGPLVAQINAKCWAQLSGQQKGGKERKQNKTDRKGENCTRTHPMTAAMAKVMPGARLVVKDENGRKKFCFRPSVFLYLFYIYS